MNGTIINHRREAQPGGCHKPTSLQVELHDVEFYCNMNLITKNMDVTTVFRVIFPYDTLVVGDWVDIICEGIIHNDYKLTHQVNIDTWKGFKKRPIHREHLFKAMGMDTEQKKQALEDLILEMIKEERGEHG